MKRLAALAMLGAASIAPAATPDWQQAELVQVTLSNFAFTPSALHLHKGQPYRLHFVNEGSGGHNFSAPEFFKAAQIDPDDGAKLHNGTVDLEKGAAQDIRLVPSVGSYTVKCTHFMHSAFGMKGSIDVN
jgi:plastocyanin